MVPGEFEFGSDEIVGRAIAFAGKVVGARFVETLTLAGGSLPAWQVLFTLANQGAVSQRELAKCIHLESATVTYHLDRLDAAGLITRRRDETDRRVWRAELTPAGIEAFARMKDAALRFETALRADLGDGEISQFFTTLARISANAEAFDPVAEIPTDDDTTLAPSTPPSPRTPQRSA
jgi:MarR family transcriptional regulator for hemolysin